MKSIENAINMRSIFQDEKSDISKTASLIS